MIRVNKSLFLLMFSFIAGLLLVSVLPNHSYSKTTDSKQQASSEPSKTDNFVYNSAGRRDPFVPLIQQIRKSKKKPSRNLGPLEKFDLSQFRLLAMLIVKGTPRAMVKAPDGKSYTVKPGDPIGVNGGVVKRIETKTIAVDEASGQRIEKSPDRIVIEETGVDNYTGKITREERYIEM